MPKEKKRADIVGSARSRKGQVEQDKMTAEISQLAGRLAEVLGEEFIQVEVEPILKKLDKKKLN
mgnify:FL=1|tara:strand:- start:39 stop:230 length:192 start_codon:yes stop_codon:yes gene_type:complete